MICWLSPSTYKSIHLSYCTPEHQECNSKQAEHAVQEAAIPGDGAAGGAETQTPSFPGGAMLQP